MFMPAAESVCFFGCKDTTFIEIKQYSIIGILNFKCHLIVMILVLPSVFLLTLCLDWEALCLFRRV